jgi:hypothetical protein
MRIKLHVETVDGSYSVTTSMASIVAFERKYKIGAGQLANDVHIEWLAFLAWESARRAGIVVPIHFEDYLDQIINIEPEDAGPENPTQAAPTDTL